MVISENSCRSAITGNKKGQQQMHCLRTKRKPSNVILEQSSELKQMRILKKGLLLDGIKGVVTPEQDPTQLVCEKELKENMSSNGKHQQLNAYTNINQERDPGLALRKHSTCQHWPHGSGFRYNAVKKLWSLSFSVKESY